MGHKAGPTAVNIPGVHGVALTLSNQPAKLHLVSGFSMYKCIDIFYHFRFNIIYSYLH